ncbi:MAG TPA: rhodanese-like domain-containing protein [Streptosporangiaceae bacterium]|nr:rhodanese-like domain-containing protein [Streptosporangiaceae bacterium]
MVREVDVRAFAAAHRDGAVVVDVREAFEYMSGHVPGARLLPMSTVHSRLNELPRSEPVYVICASGNRSLTAASWMVSAGIDARSVAGGTGAWASAGGPLVTHARA